jgi:tRNA(Ile)-lysidine synthase
VNAVREALSAHTAPGQRVVVGLSGGVDSVVLLHALSNLASSFGLSLSAVHVHHGISPNAENWAAFCVQLCERLHVPCDVLRVRVDRRRKLGLEAAARAARYAAFRATQSDIVALAHHRDDQAETLLLQLLRGAGVRGLSAMPRVRPLENATPLLLRPLLDITRDEIVSYARAAHLSWVDDESNADTGLDRNFLRTDVLPLMKSHFPAAGATLARSAENLAEAAQLLDEMARADAQGAVARGGLDVAALRALSAPRARNLLRFFLEQEGLVPPSRARLLEALHQALAARSDANVQVRFNEHILRRHRGRLYLASARHEPTRWQCNWHGQPRVDLPGTLGALHFESALGAGLALARLREPVLIRPRTGGERIRLAPGRVSRTLKNLLQEAQVPQWRRNHLPLLFSAGELVWVPDIGVDSRYAAQRGEEGVIPRWVSAASY